MDFILFFCYNNYGDTMKNKGFTMVELLATLVILSIIMLIAVPRVTTILSQNKKQTFINDAKKFISLAEQEARRSSYQYECYTLNNASNHGACYNIATTDIETSPYDEKYLESSRVLQCSVGGIYYYKVYLTDGKMSIEGASKVASKDKALVGEFTDINESSDKKYDLVTEYNSNYTVTCN